MIYNYPLNRLFVLCFHATPRFRYRRGWLSVEQSNFILNSNNFIIQSTTRFNEVWASQGDPLYQIFFNLNMLFFVCYIRRKLYYMSYNIDFLTLYQLIVHIFDLYLSILLVVVLNTTFSMFTKIGTGEGQIPYLYKDF